MPLSLFHVVQPLVVSDGAGLFCGVIKHLLDRGSNCPKVLAATHFHEVFRTDLLDYESVPVTFLHMEVMFTTTNRVIPADENVSIVRNGTEHLSLKSQHWEEGGSQAAGPGERITYLYRCAAAAHIVPRVLVYIF